jgi:hypothetical protein
LVNSGKVIQPLDPNLKVDSTPTQPLAATPANSQGQTTNNVAEPQATSRPITPTYDPSSVYPTATQTTANTPSDYAPIGLTGSQIQQQKVRLPIGIYIIAGYNLVGFAIGFFDSSQNSGIYTIVMLIDLMLAIGLLLRLEVARKIILWLEGITLVLTIASLFLLVGLQQRIQTLKTNYDAAISRIDQSKLTPTQKQQLDDIQAAIAVKQKQAGKAITFTYFKLGATAVGTIVVIIYLTRPKVKEVFHELES